MIARVFHSIVRRGLALAITCAAALSAMVLPVRPASAMTNGQRLSPAPPWMALVILKDGWFSESLCSGAVVGNGWVLTAAHCVYRSNTLASTSDVRVFLGRDDRDALLQGVAHTVSAIRVMPGYDPTRRDGHDAVLLQLSGFDATRWHALPLALDSSAVNDAGGVTLVGYGNTGFDTTDPALQTKDHEIGSGKLWKSPDGAFVRNTSLDGLGFVCFGRTSTTQAMSGDSGAPWLRWVSGAWQIIAVHSIVVSPTSRPGDHQTACGTSPLAPTNNGSTLLGWVRTTAGLTAPTPNTVVRDSSTGQSWWVGLDRYRRYIANGGDEACLIARGAPVVSLSRIVIETMPDRVGTAATCVPPDASDGSRINTGVWYEIKNVNSGQCIDTRGAGTANGTAVQQYWCNRSDAQKFRFVDAGGGYFQILRRNAGSQSLDVKDRSTADGALIQTWSYGGGTNQRWWAESLGYGRWRFRPQHSGKCIDVPGASQTASVQLQQYTCNGTGAQAFVLTVVG